MMKRLLLEYALEICQEASINQLSLFNSSTTITVKEAYKKLLNNYTKAINKPRPHQEQAIKQYELGLSMKYESNDFESATTTTITSEQINKIREIPFVKQFINSQRFKSVFGRDIK